MDFHLPPVQEGPYRPVGNHVPYRYRATPSEDFPATCTCDWSSWDRDWAEHAADVALKEGRIR